MKRLLCLTLLLCYVGFAVAANVIEDARLWSAARSTRLVLDLKEAPDYNVFTLENPTRLVVDIKASRQQVDFKKLPYSNSGISSIRQGRQDGQTIRLVLDLKEDLPFEHFSLEPNENYGHRLVIDLLKSGQATQVTTLQTAQGVKTRPYIIAIDAGHGGEDPGAVGRKGTLEKDVVLAIAKKLKILIDKEPNMTAVLTRKSDYFVRLRERISIARDYGADIFISIHADGFHDARARGASVYVLSKRGASSEAAKWLAEKENSTDLIGGISLDDKDDVLASVLLDLSQTASQSASHALAESLLSSIDDIAPLHKKQVERAGFAVLKSPDIPSVLVETEFISNPRGETRLKNSKYQYSVAKALLRGLKQYTRTRPQPLAVGGPGKAVVSIYKVQKGDTLSEIAAHYHISVEQLKQYNTLRHDNIQVGQVLNIPNA